MDDSKSKCENIAIDVLNGVRISKKNRRDQSEYSSSSIAIFLYLSLYWI